MLACLDSLLTTSSRAPFLKLWVAQLSEDPGVIMVFKVLVALSVSAQFTDHNRLLSIFGHGAPIFNLIKSNSSRFKVYQYRGVIKLRVLFK